LITEKLGVPREDEKSKPVFWIDAGIHAREWITTATALYVIYKLAEKHETDSEIRYLLNKFDWMIFPTINPDGYIHTRTKNRLWRKNRAIPKAKPIRFLWSLFTDCVGNIYHSWSSL
jgi:zinc carboxypeptidase family protein